jgi:hypothetical protein
MNKKTNLACFALLMVGLISSLTSNLVAQNKLSADVKQEQKVNTAEKVLQNYIDISSLPMNKRPATFSRLSAEDKANLFKLHLALQLIKRPNLTNQQRDFILESVLIITADSYNTDAEARTKALQAATVMEASAKTLFPAKEVFEIFASLGGNETDIELLRKYQQVTASAYESERKENFRALSAQGKSNTIRIHLVLQMVSRSLSKVQCEFVSEAISLFSPDIYRITSTMPEWKQVDETLSSFKDRMFLHFQNLNAAEIFASLGGVKGSPSEAVRLFSPAIYRVTNTMPERKRVDETLSSCKDRMLLHFQNVNAAEILAPLGGAKGSPKNANNPPLCSCSSTSDWCGFWEKGAGCGGANCSYTIGGCGTGLYYDCTGLCYLS